MAHDDGSAATAETDRPRRHIRLLVEYDGTRYAGWQRQAGQRTVQGELERAAFAIVHHDVSFRVAGRTDAGVHALGQVTTFHTTHSLPATRFAQALNHHLPRDITVHRAEEAAADFDPRHSSVSKRYRYRVYHGPQAAALLRRFSWHLIAPIDVEAMRRAAAHLIGELDFEAFRSSHCDAEHARRAMYSITVGVEPRPPVGEIIDLTFHANAFCRHMCRILAGTLIEVGLGKRTIDSVAAALASRKRADAGMTAPPGGLTLLEVNY